MYDKIIIWEVNRFNEDSYNPPKVGSYLKVVTLRHYISNKYRKSQVQILLNF